MGTITALKPSDSDPELLELQVDGHPAGTLPRSLVDALGLKPGANFDAEGLLPSPDPLKSAWSLCLRWLAINPRTEHELRRRLREQELSPSQCDQILARLTQQGLLNDQAYAEARARQGVLYKTRSSRKIQAELKHRGIPEVLAKEATATVLAAEGLSNFDLCLRAAQKKLRSLAREEPERRRHKLLGYLARQGFGFDDARRAVEVCLSPGKEGLEES